jgi:Mn2+/Fe2+ NRAMP family transporter|tara:strand:- start:219 stop:1424 length:1206 start_codon:yes stop_codon:yes gene_type:complete
MNKLKRLGPGLLFAGAAIGVSHLVYSTRAGADYGWGLLWAFLIINAFKYPFFEFGPRYAIATGETLLDGYNKIGKKYLWFYAILNTTNMFTIQAAVTIVTAGLAAHFFGISADISVWGSLIIIISSSLLIIGKYNLLDKLMKLIIVILSICTLLSFILAINNSTEFAPLHQILPKDSGLLFLIAFMGWMPAPMDISIWHSIWSVEKQREIKNISFKETIYDFNVGYITTIFLGFCFIGLGSLVMFNTEIEFSDKGLVFAGQLIDLYTLNLGKSFTGIISLAAFTTMLSTTITTLDASPRAFSKTIQLLFEKDKDYYLFFLFILSFGTIGIFLFFQSEMGFLVQIATVLSFLTTPFFAWINLKLITSEFIPKKFRPSKLLIIFSWFGLVFLSAFTIGYLLTL